MTHSSLTKTRASSERTPLLNSTGMSETYISKAASDMPSGVSWGVAAFLLVNTALGAGMLNYPYAFEQVGGILPAVVMQIILLVFISSTMFILVYCADFNQDDSYHDVLLSMCGKKAQQFSALSILLTCYGINITFLVIIGDQYDRMFNSLLADQWAQYWFLDRKFTILATAVLFIWPMCYARRIEFLRHASVLGMFAMLYVAFLTVYEHYKLDEATIAATVASYQSSIPTNQHATTTSDNDLMNLHNTTNNTTTTSTTTASAQGQLKKYVTWFETLAVVPVLCFAYQTHEIIVPVYACMKQRVIGQFMKATAFGLVILFLLYNLVGVYGYLTFGSRVHADIMSLYDAKDPVVVIGIVALVIKFITTYPPLMFCGRGALDGLYGELRKLSADEFKSSERNRRIVISTIWFLSTVALAIFAPDISVTLQLLGSMAAVNVFVFPGMCLVSLTRRLRRARLAMLANCDDYFATASINNGLAGGAGAAHRTKDYYVISGSQFGALKRHSSARRKSFTEQQQQQQQQQQQLRSNNTAYKFANSNHPHPQNSRQFTATFASLIEFENNYRSSSSGSSNNNYKNNSFEHARDMISNGIDVSDKPNPVHADDMRHTTTSANNNSKLNGFGSRQEQQRRQEEFERLITNGSGSAGGGGSFSSSSMLMSNNSAGNMRQQQRNLDKSSSGTHAAAATLNSVGRTINDSSFDDEYTTTATTTTTPNGNTKRKFDNGYDDACADNKCNPATCCVYNANNHSSGCAMKAEPACGRSVTLRRASTHNAFGVGKDNAPPVTRCKPLQTLSFAHSPVACGQPADTSPSKCCYSCCCCCAPSAIDTTARNAPTHALNVDFIYPQHQVYSANSSIQHQQHQSHYLSSSWHNRSATNSILERLGSSIAPSVVGQIGISRLAAFGLYTFAAFLILFGLFIFVLELVTVFGFV